MILWAFYRHGISFEALVQPLRASAQAGDRSGHIKLFKYLRPTEPGSAATSPVLRYLGPKSLHGRIQITGDHPTVLSPPSADLLSSM